MEGFVDIENYEGLYKVNIKGDVWSVRNNRLLKPVLSRGYKSVVLCNNTKRKMYRIHRLIMIHFIHNPENLPCVDHVNRNRQDNRIENLKWSSIRDNNINRERVENRKGNIIAIPYTRVDGTNTTTYRLRYNLPGEHGNQYRKRKNFKTLHEAESFRNEIYNLN